MLTGGKIFRFDCLFRSSRVLDVDNSLVELLEGRPEDTTGCVQTRLLCIAASKGNDPAATNLQKALWLIASRYVKSSTTAL